MSNSTAPPWPTRPDGSEKTMGELTDAEQAEQVKAAWEPIKKQLESPAFAEALGTAAPRQYAKDDRVRLTETKQVGKITALPGATDVLYEVMLDKGQYSEDEDDDGFRLCKAEDIERE